MFGEFLKYPQKKTKTHSVSMEVKLSITDSGATNAIISKLRNLFPYIDLHVNSNIFHGI